jgi:hypothetical protein
VVLVEVYGRYGLAEIKCSELEYDSQELAFCGMEASSLSINDANLKAPNSLIGNMASSHHPSYVLQ